MKTKWSIDINCDLGEGLNNEAQLMPYISSCNIACGVQRPTPTFLLMLLTKGNEINNPMAVQNRAIPICESFSENLFLMYGIYNTQVPVRIFIEANTQTGAK